MPTEDLSDRLNRLDAMLLAIDDDEAMLLGELDGYICGVMVCPETILPDEWLPAIFADVLPEALSAAGELAELHELILERYAEIAAELSADHYQPLYEVDTDDSMMWEIWVLGFERAMGLRLTAWEKLLRSRKESIAQESIFDIMSLLDFIHAEPPPDKATSLAVAAEAPDLIPVLAGNLFRVHYLPRPPSVRIRADSVGRNDPCPCGSGLKYKRCHGKT